MSKPTVQRAPRVIRLGGARARTNAPIGSEFDEIDLVRRFDQ